MITEPGDLHSDQSRGLEDCGARVNKDLKHGYFWEILEFLLFDYLLSINETFKLLSSSRHGTRSIFYEWGLDQILYL